MRRLILSMVLAEGYRNGRRAEDAVAALARAAHAYRGLQKLVRDRTDSEPPQLLTEYEEACAHVLGSVEPGHRSGLDAVDAVVLLARRTRSPGRPRPSRAISALDALITVGRSTSTQRFDRRVVRELARMVGARVLFHRRDGRWLTLRPQDEHTLSSWTIHRLSRIHRLRSFRVRARPEFWRPEQRRPGGVLVLPIGGGVACLARKTRFGPRSVSAVRTVLRFLEARLAAQAEPAAPVGAPKARRLRSPVSDGLVGESPVWKALLRQVGRVAESTASVVLFGETGTGKEQVARALHAASLRSPQAFVPVNCGAIPPPLLASELFGHLRGAFTGADRAREGLFVRAHRGTLFLDEVADTPPEMQVALLRVLEEREVRPVGSTRPVPVDVRIVAASARDLADEVTAGRFREDLYHRLNVVRLDLPPLRARREDIPLLATHLAARSPERAAIHPDALQLLAEQDWPGNVRELDNVIRASAVLAEGDEITPEIVRGVMAQRRLLRRGPPSPAGMHPRERALLETLGGEWLSAPEIAARLGISPRTVNRDLGALLTRGLVDTAGEARARRYGRVRR